MPDFLGAEAGPPLAMKEPMVKWARPAAILSLGFATACVTNQDGELTLDEASQDIVGGTTTQITSVPWQVSLQDAQGGHFCGGSIVTPTWIVTASHCLSGGAPPPARVVAGISRLSQSAAGQIKQVKRVIVYPGFTDPTTGKDAALIELTTPLTLDGINVKAIRPITARSPAALTAVGVMTTVSGWGATVEGGATLPDQLLSVQVPIVPLTAANTAYNMTITADQLPAGVAAGGKDSCQGDSGGPLIVMNGTEPMLAGIVSWGEGCARANTPGLYARVGSFATWMDGFAGGPPTAVAGADVTVGKGEPVNLDATASTDTGFGEITSYAWTQVGGAPVTLAGADAMNASFTAPSTTGVIELELTVRDGSGNNSTDRVVVTVSASGGGGGSGGGSGGGTGTGDETADNAITGGCSTGGRGNGSVMILVGLGLLIARHRRT